MGRDPGQYQAPGDSGGFLAAACARPIGQRCVCQWRELGAHVWYDMQGDDPYLQAFCRYQPDATEPDLVQLWNSQVRWPGQEALQSYYGVLKAQHGLDEVFRYQPLAILVDRLKGEPVR